MPGSRPRKGLFFLLVALLIGRLVFFSARLGVTLCLQHVIYCVLPDFRLVVCLCSALNILCLVLCFKMEDLNPLIAFGYKAKSGGGRKTTRWGSSRDPDRASENSESQRKSNTTSSTRQNTGLGSAKVKTAKPTLVNVREANNAAPPQQLEANSS